MDTYKAATKPTMYFIGVTTGQSAIRQVFPLWADYLNLGDCQLVGIDLKLRDQPKRYREAVEFIKQDSFSLGALVTTHKVDLYSACRDIFDVLDPLSASMGEVSSIFKRERRLHGRAVDPISSGLALEAFLPAGHWKKTKAEAFILGAGGSAVALTWYLAQGKHGPDRPTRIHVADRSQPRLEHLKTLHASWNCGVPFECHLVPFASDADKVLGKLKPGSLVVNATGLGKDTPGSPLTDAAEFPAGGLVWEFNYRGDLLFLEQALAQQQAKGLHVEDGWNYFVHGWTRVIADVFGVDVPTRGKRFDELSRLAASVRGASSETDTFKRSDLIGSSVARNWGSNSNTSKYR